MVVCSCNEDILGHSGLGVGLRDQCCLELLADRCGRCVSFVGHI